MIHNSLARKSLPPSSQRIVATCIRFRALKAMVILALTCLLGCGDEKPSSDSSRSTADTSGAQYANVKQIDESKEVAAPVLSAESALLQLKDMVGNLCGCETLACSQKADIELGRVSEGMRHLKMSQLSESDKESVEQLVARAESCRAKHIEPGTPAMALEHFKAYADEVCASTDRLSLEAVKKKFSGSEKRFSHIKREDFGAMWEEGAKHSQRANKCRMAIELQPRQSP